MGWRGRSLARLPPGEGLCFPVWSWMEAVCVISSYWCTYDAVVANGERIEEWQSGVMYGCFLCP